MNPQATPSASTSDSRNIATAIADFARLPRLELTSIPKLENGPSMRSRYLVSAEFRRPSAVSFLRYRLHGTGRDISYQHRRRTGIHCSTTIRLVRKRRIATQNHLAPPVPYLIPITTKAVFHFKGNVRTDICINSLKGATCRTEVTNGISYHTERWRRVGVVGRVVDASRSFHDVQGRDCAGWFVVVVLSVLAVKFGRARTSCNR